VTKRELVIEVAERLSYTQNEVASIVQAALDAITESLAVGERLEIRNFGVFEVKSRDSRIGRNPRTGEEVPIQKKKVATFKPGKALKELVQRGPEAMEELFGKSVLNTPRPAAPPVAPAELPPVEASGQQRLL